MVKHFLLLSEVADMGNKVSGSSLSKTMGMLGLLSRPFWERGRTSAFCQVTSLASSRLLPIGDTLVSPPGPARNLPEEQSETPLAAGGGGSPLLSGRGSTSFWQRRFNWTWNQLVPQFLGLCHLWQEVQVPACKRTGMTDQPCPSRQAARSTGSLGSCAPSAKCATRSEEEGTATRSQP